MHKERIQVLIEENQSLQDSLTSLTTSISESNTSGLAEEFAALTETYTKSQREMQRLRQHLIEAEEVSTQESVNAEVVLQEYKYQIEGLVSEKETWRVIIDEERVVSEHAKLLVDELEEVVGVLKEENGKMKSQVHHFATSLGNLEGVLEAFQKSKFRLHYFDFVDKDVEIGGIRTLLEEQVRVVDAECDDLRKRVDDAESELKRIDASADDVEKLKADLSEKNKTMGKLRHDCKFSLSLI